MQTITVDDKYDFTDLVNVLVKNKYKVEVIAKSLKKMEMLSYLKLTLKRKVNNERHK